MKKNITINMFGSLYAIDEDAYDLLERYLESMKNFFGTSESGREIVDDIEHRVAELLWQKRESGMEAVSIDDVRDIISRIGNARDIDTEGDDTSHQATQPTDGDTSGASNGASSGAEDGATSDTATQSTAPDDDNHTQEDTSSYMQLLKKRRLFRDEQTAVLGGVCGGLAQFFGKGDIILWRLLFVVLGILPYFWDSFIVDTIPMCVIGLYIIMWIVVPVPHTAEDRLRMKGEEVTAEAINEELLKESARNASTPSTPRNDNRGGCLRLFLIALLVLLLSPAVCAFLFAVLVMGILVMAWCGMAADVFPLFTDPDMAFVTTLLSDHSGIIVFGLVCLLMVFALPLWFIIRALRGKAQRTSATAYVVMLLLWLCSVAGCVFSITSVAMNLHQKSVEYMLNSPMVAPDATDNIDDMVQDTLAVDTIG